MSKLGVGPIDHILCPTDFSSQSEKAFRHSLAVSVACKAATTLLHVGPEHRDKVDWQRFPGVREILIDWGLLTPDSRRKAISDELKLDVNKTALRDCNRTQGILAYLDKYPADLLVLAASPDGGPISRLRSSVLRDLIRLNRQVPCLLLPGHGEGLVGVKGPRFQVRHAMLAWDKETRPRTAIQFAASLLPILVDTQVEVTLLHPVGRAPDLQLDLPGMPGIAWRLQEQTGTGPVDRLLFDQCGGQDLLILAHPNRGWFRARREACRLEKHLRQSSLPLLLVPEDY